MHQLSKTVILTRRTYPHICGVGDYSIQLATNFKANFKLKIDLIVEQSCKASSETISIVPYVDNWSKSGFDKLLNWLESQEVKTIIFQYAPWLYSLKGANLSLINFWQECAKRFQTILITHETYYWFLKYPGTWLSGLFQQYMLKSLVNASHQVFCGSEIYLKQVKRFSNNLDKIHYLPIPNNISPQIFSTEEHLALRQKLGIAPNQLVLTLFGCLGSIRQDWVASLDNYLHNSNFAVTWLLLGNARSVTVSFCNSVIRPGYLNENDLSHFLQISDLLLMPHEFGIGAKRGSLMSALEHGIPIVGTSARLTDSFLHHLPSLFLSPDGDYPAFKEQVLNTFNKLTSLDDAIQQTKQYYHNNLSWSVVTKTLLPYLQD